ncbi:Bipolar DNA helicase [Flavobacterium rivuli WB 3.3-2 = DSM 21788]|uniref:Bipolar DNA helicase n=1 Tax=Flavobacterium rivuli WB 3.3-2 = DSM 21788 TaxID=1121895 RepID=A0A0A2MCG0_9FLAO|nr:ATP-binding protein [Flavobacterium rivuli]KGO85975.1 Bipolar DNA helicase [Flavobacterium rivuli WB 3.3-2 = DSM 21788]
MNSENFKIISVSSNFIKIEVIDPTLFENQFNIGSYIKIPYKNINTKYVVGIIENYNIKDKNFTESNGGKEDTPTSDPSFVLEVKLIGTISKNGINDIFERGGHGIPLPPNNGIELLNEGELNNIYSGKISPNNKFCFSKLVQNIQIDVPVNGNKFFNKHFAIVGSTGSGKSHTVAKILQEAINAKAGDFKGLNNSHVVIFDIHGEYKTAFPSANYIDINNLILPYWLLNSEELEELFIETETNDHNQRSAFQESITSNKKIKSNLYSELKGKLNYDSPTFFDLSEILIYFKNRNNEVKNKSNDIEWNDLEGSPFIFNEETNHKLFTGILKPLEKGTSTGTQNAKFINFISRLEIKLNDRRLDFLLGEAAKKISFFDTIKQFIGYPCKLENNGANIDKTESNVTIIDLGGIPFEVLSITVSLISRILFEYGYQATKLSRQKDECEVPLLLVYEEAHKYVPKSDLVKFRASKNAIERIAKEGRKYGVTLAIVSQRPSEISDTIFSQCNNFVTMRLTNPEDQNYVKRLLPDTLGNLTDSLSTLQSGEALIIGEAIALPSLVKINLCTPEPKSSDIKYFEIWKEAWNDANIENVIKLWQK